MVHSQVGLVLTSECMHLSGTAEAFSHLINKELLIAGIPSKVEDLEKFSPAEFKYVI